MSILRMFLFIDSLGMSYRMDLKCIPPVPIDDKSTVVQVMACCHVLTEVHDAMWHYYIKVT